eukprot:tig00001003_g6288.t1
MVQVFVRQASGLVKFDVAPEDTISSLKAKLGEESFLTYAGCPLEDDSTFAECGIQDLATINASAALLGGKVHGSLARAGKVRGQTPKVAKAEKKKRPRGRAKRREQYNRRFVNIVVGFGKKKGPNTNIKA